MRVTSVLADGYAWNGTTYKGLSQVARARPSTVLSRTSTPSTLGATLIFGCSLIGQGTDEAPGEVRAWLPRAWPTDALQWLPGLSLSVALIAPGAKPCYRNQSITSLAL